MRSTHSSTTTCSLCGPLGQLQWWSWRCFNCVVATTPTRWVLDEACWFTVKEEHVTVCSQCGSLMCFNVAQKNKIYQDSGSGRCWFWSFYGTFSSRRQKPTGEWWFFFFMDYKSGSNTLSMHYNWNYHYSCDPLYPGHAGRLRSLGAWHAFTRGGSPWCPEMLFVSVR